MGSKCCDGHTQIFAMHSMLYTRPSAWRRSCPNRRFEPRQFRDQSEFDMKATDNKYHIAIKLGHKSNGLSHRYTDSAVDLLRKVLNGDEYHIDTGTVDVEEIAAAANAWSFDRHGRCSELGSQFLLYCHTLSL